MQGGEILYSDTIIKAISELHSIEMDIFNLWKQLPNLNVSSTARYLAGDKAGKLFLCIGPSYSPYFPSHMQYLHPITLGQQWWARNIATTHGP